MHKETNRSELFHVGNMPHFSLERSSDMPFNPPTFLEISNSIVFALDLLSTRFLKIEKSKLNISDSRLVQMVKEAAV